MVIGKPSSVVATDAGAPGMFMSIADIAPEKTPTTYTPIIRAIASLTAHVKVTETRIAVAIVTESPGIAPTTSPAKAPTNTRKMNLRSIAASICSIICTSPSQGR